MFAHLCDQKYLDLLFYSDKGCFEILNYTYIMHD